MARNKNILRNIAQTAKMLEYANNKYAIAKTKAEREAERARQKALRDLQKQRELEERQKKAIAKGEQRLLKTAVKDQQKRYTESRIEETETMNSKLQAELQELEKLLYATLDIDDYIDLSSLKGKHDSVEPPKKPIFPKLSFLKSLVPGARRKHEEEIARINSDYYTKLKKYRQFEAKKTQEYNSTINSWITALEASEPDAVIDYFALVLESSVYPDKFPQHTKLAYVPESKQLVLEFDLPTIEAIPDVKQYKYVKSRDEITSTALPKTQVKKLYNSVIAQIAVRTLHEIFEADRKDNIDTIVFNGHVDTINPATGQPERPCLVTVRTTRDVFENLNLAQVDPIACLKGLNASVSSNPEELAPVRPVVEFNMVDARFVEETDMISELDERENLMDLSPYEFENLITNLFQTMGLEAKQTQSSRDGGVDCVAFDPRPIFGGKVVIQAKRYKNTVGVSAVRDLFGTMQNEGASKGILVTTSGYGKAAFEFAQGKPIELLDGSNLLYLLSEHANIEAKIVMPVD